QERRAHENRRDIKRAYLGVPPFRVHGLESYRFAGLIKNAGARIAPGTAAVLARHRGRAENQWPILSIFIFVPWAAGPPAPVAATGYLTSIVPALANFRVTVTSSPCLSGSLRSTNMTW